MSTETVKRALKHVLRSCEGTGDPGPLRALRELATAVEEALALRVMWREEAMTIPQRRHVEALICRAWEDVDRILTETDWPE